MMLMDRAANSAAEEGITVSRLPLPPPSTMMGRNQTAGTAPDGETVVSPAAADPAPTISAPGPVPALKEEDFAYPDEWLHDEDDPRLSAETWLLDMSREDPYHDPRRIGTTHRSFAILSFTSS
ncbi:hypothetical protein NW759_001550 [Fusarium solani]|nr:hypothetical protein NW759_001550 [Fusarium solani]